MSLVDRGLQRPPRFPLTVRAPMLIGAVMTLVGLVVCFWWAPGTKGRKLEEVASLRATAPTGR